MTKIVSFPYYVSHARKPESRLRSQPNVDRPRSRRMGALSPYPWRRSQPDLESYSAEDDEAIGSPTDLTLVDAEFDEWSIAPISIRRLDNMVGTRRSDVDVDADDDLGPWGP